MVCLHDIRLNSTIFTTKNKELAIFGKTLSETREKLIAFFEAFERGGIKGQDGIIDTFFSKNKKSPLTPELLDEFERFKKKFNSSSLSAEALAEQLENVDQRIIDYAKTCKNGEMTTEGFKASIDTMSFSAKAGKVALQALAMAGNMLAMWGITEVISAIHSCITASDRLKESANDLGGQFSSTKSDIEDYKTKINDLYTTINDSSSSYEDTYNARQELLTIQDEMIEKFGSEAEAVQLVTTAINGQTGALDSLTKQKWQETVNEFTNGSDKKWTERVGDSWANLWSGASNNFDRMIKEMENTEVSFRVIPRYDDEGTYKEFSKKLKENFGASITHTERDDIFTLSGDLDEIYDQLLNIQSLATNMGIGDSFLPDLSRQADEAKKTLESYQEIYNQHILYDKILDSDTYEQSFKEINDAYKKYQEEFASGNDEAIETAKQSFAEIVQGATEGISDQSVIDYFNSMYPDLQAVVGGWEFEVKFTAAIDDDANDFENEIKDAVGKFDSSNEVLNFHSKTATQEQADAYAQLNSIADEYNLTLEQLIKKLEQLGLISSNVKEDLRNRLLNLSSDPQNIVIQDLVIDDWVNSLTNEEAIIANSTAFDEALDRQKQNLDSAAISAENYNAALAEVKAQQTEISTDEIEVSFSSQLISSGESLDNFQESIASATEAYSKLLSGDYTSSELLDCIQTINKAMSDMGGSINWESLKDQADSLGMLGDEIQNISQAYAESILSDAGIDVNSGLGQMLSNVIQQIYDTEAAFGSMNNRIDSIQSSYQTLTGILQSYNETGYINLDNLQSLLTADQNLIAMLQVENGQLVLNQTAYENLVQAQLMEFKAKLDDAAAAEIETLAKQKAEEATNRNADASSTAVAKLDAETAAFNRNTSAAISNAVAKAEESGVSEKDIQDIFDKYNKVWESAQKNYNSDFPSFMGNTASSAKSAAKETEKEVDIMAELNSEMDKLQSAYESLCDIRDTYNKYGKITVDQYQELTDMGFNFLANLVDENGELGLNANAFEKLSQAKLQEMQIQMARNAIDTINGLKSEVEATEYLTYANENLRDAALSATEALLYQAQAAAHLRGEQQGLAADQIVQGYEASKLLAGKVDFTFNPSGKEETEDSKSSGSDGLLDAYNAEKKLLEHMLSMDQIGKKEYYDRLFDLVHRYFDGDEEHKDQIWDVEESYHDYLESIKETYNWIEVFLSTLAKKATALIDKAEKFITWSKKNAMINRAVKATDREIAGQTNAYAYYAEKARKVKLSDEYINKIQNGTLTMEDMQNEALSNKIEKYQEWLNCPAT